MHCFKCGTNLKEWWPLEELLSGPAMLPIAPATLPQKEGRSRWIWIFFAIVLICAGSAGIFIGRYALGPNVFPATSVSSVQINANFPPSAPVPISEPAPSPGAEALPESKSVPLVAPQLGSDRYVCGEYMIRYRVQKGDSPWRVAAALTGAGENWHLLWPELKDKPLKVGCVLELRLKKLEILYRQKP